MNSMKLFKLRFSLLNEKLEKTEAHVLIINRGLIVTFEENDGGDTINTQL